MLSFQSIHLVTGEINQPINNTYTPTGWDYSTFRFNELGIFSEELVWEGLGDFNITISKTFDLTKNGPIILVLEFIAYDDKPGNYGYEITGKFNQITFDSLISNEILPPYGDEELLQQIAIPINSTARIYDNNLILNVNCSNDYLSRQNGALMILDSSKIIVGNMLIVES
nr:hypothetical protein [Asgard group archaeon]